MTTTTSSTASAGKLRGFIGQALLRMVEKPGVREHVLNHLLTYDQKLWLQFTNGEYFRESGWLASVAKNSPVDASGLPLPWMTYSCIHILLQRLKPDFLLFEFGCGASTHFYQRHVKHVTAVEHDRAWFERVQSQCGDKVTLLYEPLVPNGAYSQTATRGGEQYHVIIVDGRDRVNCLRNSLSALRPDGVMVLDDSNRPRYSEGIEFMTSSGFRHLPLEGLRPMKTEVSTTSLFYRDANCLGI